ncbi:predicted protein [Francisella tularensis subsp. holarctica FSC022]|nr:predicted protein [Francisella tularensis subsp. holarctica FSC022]
MAFLLDIITFLQISFSTNIFFYKYLFLQISFGLTIYKERHLIENFFSKIKHFRRVFSRFDKTISAYIGMIKFVCIFI